MLQFCLCFLYLGIIEIPGSVGLYFSSNLEYFQQLFFQLFICHPLSPLLWRLHLFVDYVTQSHSATIVIFIKKIILLFMFHTKQFSFFALKFTDTSFFNVYIALIPSSISSIPHAVVFNVKKFDLGPLDFFHISTECSEDL